jgi:hypothetical protein
MDFKNPPKLYCPDHERDKIKDWTQEEVITTIPKELVAKVAHGEMVCPVCQGKGRYRVTYTSPSTTRWYSEEHCCLCAFYLGFIEDWSKRVPVKYRSVSLTSLKSSGQSTLSPGLQTEMIAELRTKPDASYAFFGPAGTSKTTYSIALFRDALFEDSRQHFSKGNWGHYPSCWRITAKQLLDEFHALSTHQDRYDDEGNFIAGAKEPTVTRRRIDQAVQRGYRPRLFLEEIDKIKGTEFRLNTLFEVIDGLYEQKGQLVVNTNMTTEEFSSAFGAALERRIVEMCVVKDFFGVSV